VPIKKVIPSLRTGTGISKIDIQDNADYIIIDKFNGFEDIIRLGGYKGKLNLQDVAKRAQKHSAHLAISRRVRLNSKETRLLTFYSDKKFAPGNALYILKIENKEDAKILSLVTNSILYLMDFYSNRIETTLGYTGVMKPDLEKIHVLNLDKLSNVERKSLLELFDKMSQVEFPYLLEQLKSKFWARIELDKTILRLVGFNETEIENMLSDIYMTIYSELKIKN